MLTCPSCSKSAIHPLQKFLLGPATHTICSECGAKISVPYGKAFLSALPIIVVAAVIVWNILDVPMFLWISFAVAVTVSTYLQKFVPLIVKK
jgi:uncharacterized protein (DUF983 family)